MHYFLLLLFICLQTTSRSAEKRIELVANFPVNPDYLNQALVERNLSLHVEISDLSQYGQALKKVKNRWIRFMRKLSIDLAPQVAVADDLSKIVFWNIIHRYYDRHELWRLPKNKLILFMWEPPSVLLPMYSPEITRYFSKIYTWNDDLVDNQTYFKFYYPVLSPMIDEIPSFEEKKLCTLVCSNITSRRHPNELYHERQKAIEYFEGVNESGFEFYGRKWEGTDHPSYRGRVDDKIATIKNYRFSICYENICNIKGYISEKIFDCFAAGNVPVYWGASNIDEFIPPDCFIDRRQFSSMQELHAFLKQMGKKEYEGYLARIQAFLSSEQAQLFSIEHFKETFCQAVSRD